MDRDIDDGCYQRVRLRRAKRLATEVFAQIEAEAREGPTETELVSRKISPTVRKMPMWV